MKKNIIKNDTMTKKKPTNHTMNIKYRDKLNGKKKIDCLRLNIRESFGERKKKVMNMPSI